MKKMSLVLLVGGSLAFGNISDWFNFFSGNSNINITQNGDNVIVGNSDNNFTFDNNDNNITLDNTNKIIGIKANCNGDINFTDNNKTISGDGWSIGNKNGIIKSNVGPSCSFCIRTLFMVFSFNNANCSTDDNQAEGGTPTTSNEHGHFDAWNDDHNITDRNITTKIANKDFNLTIASLNKDDDAEKETNIDIRVALYDNDNEKNITDDQTFNAFLYKEQNLTFKVSEAEKNVSVQFKVCSKYNGEVSPKYDLYPYEDARCHADGKDKECSPNDTDTGPCIRKFYSKDNFAIRPDHFKVSVDDSILYKADSNISTIDIEAVDENNNTVKDYNESSDELNLTAFDENPNATVADMNYSFEFKDGNATKIDYVKYPEVGKIKLQLSEINGSEFAKVDEDDTPDEDRLINPKFSNKFRVIPHHFAIKDINITNSNTNSDESSNDSNFTYISQNLENMSAELNATIVAENEANETTKNYSGGLYEKDVNFTIPFTTNPDDIGLDKIKTQYGDNDIAINKNDKNISFTIKDGNFTNGEFNLSLKINFDRDPSKPVNNFSLILNDVNATDEDNATNDESNDDNVKNDINKSKLNFRYGKADAEDVSTYSSDVTVPVHFYYYHNDEWVINKDHNNKSQGDVNDTYENSEITITNKNEDKISEGNQNIDVNANNVSSTPYKATLHLGISPWLWYSESGKNYLFDKSSSNSDCSTHPCSNIIINKIPTVGTHGWSGVSHTNERNDVNKNTVNINKNRSNNNDENKGSYHRINW